MADLVAEAEGASARAVGVGMPGTLSRSTGLVRTPTPWLIGRASNRIGCASGSLVRLASDANCFAMSEAADGAAAQAPVVFGIILGTGVGGGLVVRGEIVEGVNAIAGEWGHNPLPFPEDDERPGPACYCGRHGCIETFLSGPALAADYARHGGAAGTSGQDVVTRAEGERPAREAVDRWQRRLAKAWRRSSTCSTQT